MRRSGWLLPIVCAACAAPNPNVPIMPRFSYDNGIRMQALLFGRLAVRGGCFVILRLDKDELGFIPIWHDDSEIGRDARGAYVRNNATGAIVRPGDRVEGGGGQLNRRRDDLNREVSPAIPARCSGPYASFYAIRPLAAGRLR